MPENKSVQVMRFASSGEHLDSVTSLKQFDGYSILEQECFVSPFIPWGGQSTLVMLQGPEDKVRIDDVSYRELKHRYSGTLNPEIKKLIEQVDAYLEKVKA